MSTSHYYDYVICYIILYIYIVVFTLCLVCTSTDMCRVLILVFLGLGFPLSHSDPRQPYVLS